MPTNTPPSTAELHAFWRAQATDAISRGCTPEDVLHAMFATAASGMDLMLGRAHLLAALETLRGGLTHQSSSAAN